MNINHKEISDFHASVVSFDVKTMGIDNNIMILEAGYYPVLREQKLVAQERELIVDFIKEEDISDFTAECMRESLLDLDDGYEYVCYLTSAPNITVDGVQAYTVSYSFYVIKRKALISEIVQNEIKVLGNIWSPCILEIKSTKDIDSFILNEILITNLKAEESFIIDGTQKLIYRSTSPNQSAFDDTNLTMFPRVYPGVMKFQLSDASVSVVCKYYPTYL